MPKDFAKLETFLRRVPSVRGSIGTGEYEGGNWWVKFQLDIEHELAWRVVQELGNVMNLVSLEERLPTIFKPVSPPAYLNGGPKEYLSWVIESTGPEFSPDLCCEWLEGRMPRPVDGLLQWELEDE